MIPQLEAGLHYNWHRHCDPTIGRYTQADPLGFVDGPSVYGYAGGNPQAFVDPEGRVRGARRGPGPGRSRTHNQFGQPRLDYGKNGRGDGRPRGGVYKLRNADGNVCRVGRTNDLSRREGEHRREFPELNFDPVFRTDIRDQQRALEELLYNRYSPPLNKIRPISPRNPNRRRYLDSVRGFKY
jgi:hypothetical protein